MMEKLFLFKFSVKRNGKGRCDEQWMLMRCFVCETLSVVHVLTHFSVKVFKSQNAEK